MRIVPCLLTLIPIAACVASDDVTDLGTVADGKSDAPAIDSVAVTIKAASSSGKPGTKTFTVRSTVDFTVALAYEADAATKIVVTSDAGSIASEQTTQPTLSVTAPDTATHSYKIRLENYAHAPLSARLSVLGGPPVPPEVVAAARANLERIAKEIDTQHLDSYALGGSTTDQFLTAMASEYAGQHGEQYVARMKALASMVFFALPDVKPPEAGVTTPFHGLDMTQFDALAQIEDRVFSQLVSSNGGSTNGVRPFSVCETKFIIETYVRPGMPYPGFDAYKAAYTTYADACSQADKDEWYNFRGLGGLRPSWVESNLADRFLRRQVKACKEDATFGDCAAWNADRFGYRQLRNRQLAARTMYYAAADEQYLTDPNNALVLLEDRNGDSIGEFLRPGTVTLTSGETGTLSVMSSGEFSGTLQFTGSDGMMRTITPKELVAEDAVDPRWSPALLADPDLGLMSMFSDSTNCTGEHLDPAQCPLMRRFYSMIDRHENFYRTYSGLSANFSGVSSQPSPLVACSITLSAAHQWDSAGTPAGGTAGFIYLMRIPFADIVTGNDTSVATLMPGPKTTSIQSLYAGTTHLDMTRAWLDVASLSNNQYAGEHEISAFGAVPANEIEGILVVRKPAAVP